MGNRTSYKKSRNGKVQESAEYTYNVSNQMIAARLYDGKHYKNVEYTYDADGNRIMQEEIKPLERKMEFTYDYTVENRLKAVSNKNDLLVAMAYDGDGNRIFQLNYNLHTDDDWKGNSGNGNGNNKDNSGSGNSGNSKTKEGKKEGGILSAIASFFTGGTEESEPQTQNSDGSNKANDNGNNGNNGNGGNGNHKGWENGNSGSDGTGNTGAGNTTNTGGSTNQSGILFPIEEEVSELESELIGRIKTTGKEKNYELVEYVNDVNREYTEVLMELNINGIMDTAYSYGNERLTNERFTEWTGYYTYDIRGSVSGITDSNGMIWQSYRYNVNGEMTFGKPQYNNVYGYNAESYNPNMDTQYLRARYYSPETANFLTEDSYLGNVRDPLSLNRYNYVKSSPLNYVDPSGHVASAFVISHEAEREEYYSPVLKYVANHNIYEQLQELNRSDNGVPIIGSFVKKAEGITHDIKSYCESYIVGVKTSFYLKDTDMQNLFADLFGSERISDKAIHAYLDELIDCVEDFNDGAYMAGRPDGEVMYAILQFMEIMNLIQMLSGPFIGGMNTGSHTGTLVTPEGFVVQVEVAGELIGAGALEGALSGAAIQAIRGSSKGESDSKLPNQGTVKGDVENAPSVDAGKQGKHVQDHPNYKEGNSTWQPGNNGVHDTQEAWINGTELPDGTRVWDTGNTVGTNGETGVRVHIDGKGNIHGYPVDTGRYLPKR